MKYKQIPIVSNAIVLNRHKKFSDMRKKFIPVYFANFSLISLMAK